MRTLQAAALFVVPILAAPVATSLGSKAVAHSQLVTLPLASGEDGFEIVTLRLDVHPTQKACDPSALSINGKPLSKDQNNSGSGTFTLEHGQPITAEWHVKCDDPSQYIDLTILTLDGDEIPHVSFSTHLFHSSQPSSSDAITVGRPHVNDAPSFHHDADTLRDLRHKELEEQLTKLGNLRAQAAELEATLKDQDQDQFSTVIQTSGQGNEHPLADVFNAPTFYQAPSDQQQSISTISSLLNIDDNNTPSFRLLETCFTALIFFSLASLLTLLYTRRHSIATALAESRARRRLRTWAERRAAKKARREARKQAVRDFFKLILGGWISGSGDAAEKRAEEEERRRQLAERQAEEGRVSERVEEQDSTMEQEIASLRRAAEMVDSLVAGGRQPIRPMEQRDSRQEQQQPPPVPARPSSIPGFVTYHHEEDSPPTYEEQIHDSAVVADGFRYVQGMMGGYHPATETSSDRLGYGK